MTTFNRSGSALIVIDVQVVIVEKAYERDRVVANIKLAVEKARAASIPVIWIQHSDEDIIRGSKEWEIVPELSPLPDEVIVEKHYRSSFIETNLSDVLEKLQVGQLYICGAETNICVRHTSHSALDLGYDITLIEDAHTCTSYEWNGYVVDAEKVIDEQNTNLLSYKLPGRTAQALAVAEINFAKLLSPKN